MYKKVRGRRSGSLSRPTAAQVQARQDQTGHRQSGSHRHRRGQDDHRDDTSFLQHQRVPPSIISGVTGLGEKNGLRFHGYFFYLPPVFCELLLVLEKGVIYGNAGNALDLRESEPERRPLTFLYMRWPVWSWRAWTWAAVGTGGDEKTGRAGALPVFLRDLLWDNVLSF